MSRRQRIIATAGALALLGPAITPGSALAERLEERSVKSVPCDADVWVNVTNLSGETVVETWERSEVQVEALAVSKSRDVDRARRLLRDLSYEVTGGGDKVTLTAHYPRRTSGGRSILEAIFGGGEGTWIEFTLRVPRDARIDVSCTSGDVDVKGVAGPVQVDATSGDIHVSGIRTDVQIECTSGDVEVKKIDGRLRVMATSGEVVAEDVKGRAEIVVSSGEISGDRLRAGGEVNALSGEVYLSDTEGDFRVASSSGDVVMRGHRGSLQVKTSSGDMEISLQAPLAELYKMDASSGSVWVEVPRDASVRVDLSTASGILRARIPIDVREVSRHRLVGVTGDGRTRLDVTTATGDIEVVGPDDL